MRYCPGCGEVNVGLLGHHHEVEPVELGVSISHGTLNPEHLIPAFEPIAMRVDQKATIIARHRYDCSPGDTDDDAEYVRELFEVLENADIPGYSFGTLEGDGSDFGFWPVEPDESWEECQATKPE